jgi:hypothetical protein
VQLHVFHATLTKHFFLGRVSALQVPPIPSTHTHNHSRALARTHSCAAPTPHARESGGGGVTPPSQLPARSPDARGGGGSKGGAGGRHLYTQGLELSASKQTREGATAAAIRGQGAQAQSAGGGHALLGGGGGARELRGGGENGEWASNSWREEWDGTVSRVSRASSLEKSKASIGGGGRGGGARENIHTESEAWKRTMEIRRILGGARLLESTAS